MGARKHWTLAQFTTHYGIEVLEGREIPVNPGILTRPIITKMQNKLRSLICEYAPKRPYPGGRLSQPDMWDVRYRPLSGADGFAFEIRAVKDSALEHPSMFGRRIHNRDIGRTNAMHLQHYAWWVEYGHKVRYSARRITRNGRTFKTRLPFIKDRGRIWRVNVENTFSRVKATGRLKRDLKRPVFNKLSNGMEQRVMVKVPNLVNRGKSVNGRPTYIHRFKLMWLEPGRYTKKVAGKFFVKRAIERFSEMLDMNNEFLGHVPPEKLPIELKSSWTRIWKQRCPVVHTRTDDHYQHMGEYINTLSMPPMGCVVIVDGKVKS